jgi:phosphoglycolate phosphatase-like HAD superfamily hydrolase
MIKAIILDFDGVLVESAHIKTEAFRKLFSKWPDKVDEIVNYHLSNMGISRYAKFKYFYEHILKEPYSDKMGLELGRNFSDIVVDEIKKASYVKGTRVFLEENFRKYLLFIASGTPHDELVDIVYFKGISKYFRGIFGTPATKMEIVKDIMKMYSLQINQIVFVGDAESDKIAAESSGVFFIARLTIENTSLSNMEWKINDMTELKYVIKKLPI